MAVELSTVRPFSYRYNALSSVPIQILDLIKLKNRHRRLWQQNRLPHLRRRYNQLNRRVRWELDSLRFKSYNKYLLNLTPDDNSLWKATKRLLREKSQIPSLHHDNTVFESKTDKANVLADYFQSAFSPNSTVQDVNFSQIVNDTLTSPLYTVEYPVKFTNPSEISHYISTFNKKKSPGHDKIPNVVLKNLSQKGINFLSHLFNACFELSYFPRTWKHSEIIVIHKPGKPTSLVSSYRPISLLPTLSKLFEKAIKQRLDTYLNRTSLIPPHQFGFRSHHSTCHQVLRVSEDIIKSFERKEYTAAVFLDVAQAFDRVWHEGLRFKLRKFGVPLYLQNMINNFLKDRTFCVKIENSFSSTRPITAGVPQGAILSPILFNIFTADIPTSQITSTAVFADDTLLYYSHPDIYTAVATLQNSTNELTNWFKKWRIAINPNKSEAKIFSLRRNVDPPNLKIINQDVVWNPSDQAIKYLGVYLDKKLNWNFHVNKKLNSAYATLSKLYPILNRKTSTKIKSGLLIYKSILRPILLYACPIWGTASPTAIKKLQVFQNKVLRIILKCPWYTRNNQIHNELGVLDISNFIVKLSKAFFQKINFTDGINFFQIGQRSNLNQIRLKPRLPQDVLDV